VNVLKAHLRITIDTLLRSGSSQRDIERRTGVSRKTIRRYAVALAAANSPGVATGSTGVTDQTPPPRPPGIPVAPEIVATGLRVAPSACEPHRAWIETQVQLGRSAMSVYQDLVDDHAFTHRYNSVKRFVAALRARAPASTSARSSS
jgi:transposase